MARLSIRHFVEKRRADGTARYYWQPSAALRKKGFMVKRLSDTRHLAMAEAEEYNAQVDQWRTDMSRAPDQVVPGTVAALARAYRESREFSKLAPATQKDYGHYLNALASWGHTTPVTRITRRDVARMYDAVRGQGERKAAYLIQVGRVLFNFAINELMIPDGTNPFARPGLTYTAKPQQIWTEEEIRHFVSVADANGYAPIGTAVFLNEWMGQREGDICRLKIGQYTDGDIAIVQNKTGARVFLPVDTVPALAARLKNHIASCRRRGPDAPMFQKPSGAAYTQNGLKTMFKRVRALAAQTMPSIAGRTFQTLRHTAVCRLGVAGAGTPLIASITGHSLKTCDIILERYSIRTKEHARAAFARRVEHRKKNENQEN